MIQELEKIYKAAEEFTNSHYENFPVISLTLPKQLRKHIAVIYQFARQADDLADEGFDDAVARINKLENYSADFQKCLNGNFENDFWQVLKNTIDERKLNPKYFFDMISAFKQDVTQKRYNNYPELMDYCRRSANPVGRLMLQLFEVNDEIAFKYSDSICTALQLTNFYQDVSIDYLKERIYIPLDEMEKFGVSENIFEKKQNNAMFQRLMRYQVNRAFELFAEGKNLLIHLPKSFLIQMKMTILGGEKILKKIESMDFNVLTQRPKLSKLDYFEIFVKGVLSNAR